MNDDVLIFDKEDDSTKEDALIIQGAENEEDGVHFEYQVLGKLYPGYTTLSQSLIFDGGKVFDLIKISSTEQEHEVWFDISEFFGKS